MSSVADRGMFGAPNRNYDPVLPMLVLSVILHLTGLVGLALYAKYWSDGVPVKINPESYAVFLTDPSETPGEAGVGKSAIVDTAPPPPALKSFVPVEKKLVPVSKEDGGEIKKIQVVKKKVVDEKKVEPTEATPSKQLKVKTDALKQKAEAVAKEVKSKKGGGEVDPNGVPEWYVNIIKSRIYGNWDVLKVNMSVARTIKVMVMFSIDRNGNLAKVDIEQSSFDPTIDKSAIEAVSRSAPFPPWPSGAFKDGKCDMHFGFTLNQQ
jgi:TonB family protein